MLYGTRWDKAGSGIRDLMRRSSLGLSSSFVLNGFGEESLTAISDNLPRAWLGMTPGRSER